MKQTSDSTNAPDQRRLNPIQVKRLAEVSGLDANELKASNATIAQLGEKYRWDVDLELLLFRKVCGRVVKKDPTTGGLNPVPFATVHVEDTDIHLLGYFPPGWPWGWYFPLHIHREVLATVRTDRCGRFCVLVPRFDIDAVLRWRRLRLCFWEMFEPLNICDIHPEICEGLQEVPEQPFDPGPWISTLKDRVGPYVAALVAGAQMNRGFGDPVVQISQLLQSEVGRARMPPPISNELREIYSKKGNHALAKAVGQPMREIERASAVAVDRGLVIGPFRRCVDVVVPEWKLILDVPDISFRVTQDVDGDGNEETIYDEGLFDVRWDAGSIPDVTLEASQIAISVPASTCHVLDVPCAEPAIVLAGLMPVQNPPAPEPPYHDALLGTATRVNRPHDTGALSQVLPPDTTGSTPYCWDLQLRGCNEKPGAKYYRMNYRFRGSGSGVFSAPVPFTGLSWHQVRWVGSPGHLDVLTVTPDANGWYEILNPADGWMDPRLLLNWPTRSFQNGLYRLQMEFANAAKVSIGAAAHEARFRIDNAVPVPTMGISWRILGATGWNAFPPGCFLVTRSPGDTLEFKVDIAVSVSHLRSVRLYSSGCGSVRPSCVSPLPSQWQAATPDLGDLGHWHASPTDNAVSESLIFQLPPSADPGVYGFRFIAYSRAFNPAGGDGGFTADYFYNPVYLWDDRYVPFAVINA